MGVCISILDFETCKLLNIVLTTWNLIFLQFKQKLFNYSTLNNKSAATISSSSSTLTEIRNSRVKKSSYETELVKGCHTLSYELNFVNY